MLFTSKEHWKKKEKKMKISIRQFELFEEEGI